jgi:hypothetical protein
MGPKWGKAFLYLFTFEINLIQNQQANFSQSWYKSFLGKGI